MSGREVGKELLLDLALSAGIEVAGNGAVLGCGGSWRWCGTWVLAGKHVVSGGIKDTQRFELQATNSQPKRADLV